MLTRQQRVLRTLRGTLRRRGAAVAVLTWLVTAPLAAAIPALAHVNPFTQRGADLAPAVGGLVALAAAAAAWRWRRPAMAGMAAGLLASFVVLVLRTALHGTPFPFEGVDGDTGRLAAMATRYTIAWGSHDGIVASVASEYPPLFPWSIGKAAVLLGVPAWRMVAPAEIIVVSGSVVAGFALWTRLTTPPAALAIGALGLAVFSNAAKGYEVLALAVFVPWVLLTFAEPDRSRLHWLPAGIIGGLLVMLYYAYFIFAVIGLLVVAAAAWRAAPDRRRYLRHVGAVVGLAALISSWFLIPYGWALLGGGQQVGDMFHSSAISENPFPFLDLSLIGLVQLAGLACLIWQLRSSRWAGPLLAIVVGAYGYRAVSMLRWVVTGHSGLLHYTTPLISACLVAGCVLGLAEALPSLARRLPPGRLAGTEVIVLAVVCAAVGFGYWRDWMPAATWYPTAAGGDQPGFSSSGYHNSMTVHAHVQPFPDGHRSRFAQLAGTETIKAHPWFPVGPIQRSVETVLGRAARPHTLSWNEELFAFLPWDGYVGVDRNASLAPVRWDDRYAEVLRISRLTDPAVFADATEHTAFGRIDVFVLHREGAASPAQPLVWRPLRVPTAASFRPGQFAADRFTVTDLGDTFVAVRRPRP